jgi:Na+/phosphate symporter
MDLSEEFKNKVTVVFEAAVNEEVSSRVQKIELELNEKLETELHETVESKINDIVENLDAYLDYVVTEWMEENEVAIEAGIKVEMAESLMEGLKDLFSEHNIKVDEETYDIVSDLEEEMATLEEKSNRIVDENIRLGQEIKELQSSIIFEELTSDLNMTQRERLKVLSANLDTDDLEAYAENLQTIRESFFKETNVSSKRRCC